MTPIEGADWGVLAAIATMAVATYAMRAGGFWMMHHVPPSARLRRMLEALPGSVIVATVLPIVARDGITAMLAIAAAVAVMLVARRDILAVFAGMAVAASARALGLVAADFDATCRSPTGSIRSANCSRIARAAFSWAIAAGASTPTADADAAALGVAAVDLLRAGIQESPARRLGPLLHRAVLPRRGDGARRRPPPCFECRRRDAVAFAERWRQAFGFVRPPRAGDMDERAASRAPRWPRQAPASATRSTICRTVRSSRWRRAPSRCAAVSCCNGRPRAMPRAGREQAACCRRPRSSMC